MKELPDLTCNTCGNCEKKFHKSEKTNFVTGFCLRFKENTSLDEKNPACWTTIENDYYKGLVLTQNNKIAKNHNVMKKAVKDKNLILPDQLTLFN
jgi:hypothetical protein